VLAQHEVDSLRAGCDIGLCSNFTFAKSAAKQRIMPPKRFSTLNTPNPIKHHVFDLVSSTSPSRFENEEPKSQPHIIADGSAVSALPSSVVGSDPAPQVTSPSSPLASAAVDQKIAAVTDVVSPTLRPASAGGAPPSSPGNNRAAFISSHTPSRIVCNMAICRSPPGTKVSLSAVVIAVFDANSNPDRRYIQLADGTGSVGITIWNANVARFSRESIGKVVKCGKVVVGSHQGKKVLTTTRESTIEFVSVEHPLMTWWNDLLLLPPVRLSSVCDIDDNAIINVNGIVGMIVCETKMVGTVQKTLTTMHLADPSGQFDIKSWNHDADQFLSLADQPVAIRRIRVTSFAGTKMGELLDNGGSTFVTEFPGKAALLQYWAE
jgi:hypothetical protein